MRRMLLLTLLLAGALAGAGCAAPEEGEEADPLFGLCPQWTQGGGAQTIGLHLAGNATERRELGPANETFRGKALDLYRVKLDKLVVDGARVELRAFDADGRQLPIRDYRQERPQLVPVVVFTDGSAAGSEFDVFLSSVDHDSEPGPAPATLEWRQDAGDTQVDVSVTYHYKVCGMA